MVTKMKRGTEGATQGNGAEGAAFADTVKESASQIWLAGLGAFAKAQEEGGKVFDALVKEGLSLQKRSQSAAEDKLSEAATRMAGMANDLSSKASGQWDKLETIFEDRVSRALGRLGVPTARDIEVLVERIDALQRAVDSMGGAARPAQAAKSAAKAPAKAAPKTAPRAPRRAAAKKAA